MTGPRLERRLAELATLEAGWLDGAGSPPTPAAMAAGRAVLAAAPAAIRERLRVFPAETGGLTVEDDGTGPHWFCVDIGPDGTPVLFADSVGGPDGLVLPAGAQLWARLCRTSAEAAR